MGGAGVAAPQAKATATGVRPIRIEVPRTGQAFSFTKVLNASKEPLTASFSMMRLKVYRGVQMVVQVCAFVLGLIMLWWLSLRAGAQQPVDDRRGRADPLVGGPPASPCVARSMSCSSPPCRCSCWRSSSGPCGNTSTAKQDRRPACPPLPLSIPPVPAAPPPPAPLPCSLFLALGASLSPALADDAAPPALSNTVSIISATYTGTVQDKVAQFDAAFQIATTATNQIVPLFGEDVALESFAAKGDAKLVREGRTVGVLLPARGTVTLQLKLIARLGGDVTRRQLAFGIPPALSSRVSVVIDEAEADVEFPTAVSFERTSANQQTRVDGHHRRGRPPRAELDAAGEAGRGDRRHGLCPEHRAGHHRRRRDEYPGDPRLPDQPGRAEAGARADPRRPALAARGGRRDPQLGDQGRHRSSWTCSKASPRPGSSPSKPRRCSTSCPPRRRSSCRTRWT